MDHLSSCYFCGVSLDEPLETYEIPSTMDEEASVTLCQPCKRKLDKVLYIGGLEETTPVDESMGGATTSGGELESTSRGSGVDHAAEPSPERESVEDESTPADDEATGGAVDQEGGDHGGDGWETPPPVEELQSAEDVPEEIDPSILQADEIVTGDVDLEDALGDVEEVQADPDSMHDDGESDEGIEDYVDEEINFDDDVEMEGGQDNDEAETGVEDDAPGKDTADDAETPEMDAADDEDWIDLEADSEDEETAETDADQVGTEPSDSSQSDPAEDETMTSGSEVEETISEDDSGDGSGGGGDPLDEDAGLDDSPNDAGDEPADSGGFAFDRGADESEESGEEEELQSEMEPDVPAEFETEAVGDDESAGEQSTTGDDGRPVDQSSEQGVSETESTPNREAQAGSDAGTDGATGDSSNGTGAEASDQSSISALEYNKVMRLLQNREFPVDRVEIETVAASAYELSENDCAAVIDLAIDRGLLVEDSGMLYRAD